MNSIWSKIEASIRGRIPEHSYKMWFKPLKLDKIDQKDIVLSCPNTFFKKYLISEYSKLIQQTAHEILGNHLNLHFIIYKKEKFKDNLANHENEKIQITLPGMDSHSNWVRKLRKDFTFDKFVVGSNNDFAYSAALSTAAKETGGINSLFLLSKTGLGKSHLTQAIGHYVVSRFPQKRVYYVTAEDFTNEMVNCYKSNKIGQFKNKYRENCDILLIDEVQYLSGKTGTQKELASTLDFLTANGKKNIFSSSELPINIPKLSDELRSRLSGSLIAHLESPDYLTRIKILKQKVKSNNYAVPSEIMQYLAGEISGDIRQLESGLTGIVTRAELLGIAVDLPLAESVVKNIVSCRRSINVELVKKVVCKEYNITTQDLLSKSRKRAVAWPRQIAIYLSRRYTDHSLQFIGKSFNRYHATCMYAVRSVDKFMCNDAAVQKQIEILSKRLESWDL